MNSEGERQGKEEEKWKEGIAREKLRERWRG